MPYHEMRFCTIRLIEAKRKNEVVEKVIWEYLECLKFQNYSKMNFQEILIFFCNSLFWLQEFEIAFQIIKEAKSYLQNLQDSTKPNSFHYFGINKAFVKTTFALIYLANKKEINEFDFQNDDFNDYADLLYHDYIQIMYLAKSILSQKGSENKKSIFAQLEKIVQKTNYTKIYDLLERLDSEYPKYCA